MVGWGKEKEQREGGKKEKKKTTYFINPVLYKT